MLAVHVLSHGTQAFFYFVALLAFLVAAILAWIPGRLGYATLIAAGLACWMFTLFWNALALS